MKKIVTILNMILLCSFAYGKVSVKIHEPIRFQPHNIRSISNSKLVGKGTLEISTDNEIEDLGKKIVFNFIDSGVMTNKKNWIKVEKYQLKNQKKEMLITKKRELIDVYAIVDKSQFKNYQEAERIEGEYVGRLPIVLSLYSTQSKEVK